MLAERIFELSSRQEDEVEVEHARSEEERIAAPKRINGEAAENVKYEKKMVIDNILEAIGETPLVRLNYIPKMFGVRCQVCKF
ncbi:hypothetical protein WUBG_10670 [Wuchereria bancrofti]|uniref:Uncharacterized protein n=1 Tax=Wuchereria bancrofti TaxID=6293 RepID=J9AV80_WUCBA|nr:hypothetical protein WUBG_10670 [Wuchereria bancrofti]